MIWRLAAIVFILLMMFVGYMVEPHIYPEKVVKLQEVKAPEPVAEPEPKPEPEPEPEPEPVVDSNEEEPEPDPEGTDVTKFADVPVEEVKTPAKEEQFKSELNFREWLKPNQLQKKLASRILGALKGTSKEEVMACIADPEIRLAITQWELLHRANMDVLTQLMKEEGTAQRLAPLLNDLQWLSSFVYDGDMCLPEVALAMVDDFRKSDPNMDKEVEQEGEQPKPGEQPKSGEQPKPGVKQRIAAAVAVEFTRNGWYGAGRTLTPEEIEELKQAGMAPPKRGGVRSRQKHGSKNAPKPDLYRLARQRYAYFAESWDKGLLNSSFGDLPDWLMHFPCGWKGDSPFGTASTMRWLRDNTSAPSGYYSNMCGQVDYLPLNKFGDNIFTAELYYQPCSVLYPDNYAKQVRETGGVCGSLSHYGTSAACANGIPAVTVGEPGHCAYAVYNEGKWNPSNSISADRHPHWPIWGMHTWSAFQMMSDMYQDGQRTRNAQMVCSIATLLSSNKNPANALKLYEMAVGMQPLYNPVWTLYLQTAAKSLSRRPSKYLGVNDFICKSVGPQHPEMCANYLNKVIYPTLLQTLRTPKQKLVAFKSFFDNLEKNEEAEWPLDELLETQYNSMGKALTYRENYLRLLAETIQNKPAFGVALSWAVRKAYSEGRSTGEKIRAIVDKALANFPEDMENREEVIVLLKASIIRAAEEMTAKMLTGNGRLNQRDMDTYMELVNQYSKDYLKAGESNEENKLPDFPEPNGNNIAEGGVVMLEKYNPDQRSIVRHAAALTKEGGLIESEKGNHVKLTIELAKKAALGDVVIIPREGCGRYRDWYIETSADGKTWKKLCNLPDSQDTPYMLYHIEKDIPTAKFIRIDSGAEQMLGIDFKAVLVYDRKKAK